MLSLPKSSTEPSPFSFERGDLYFEGFGPYRSSGRCYRVLDKETRSVSLIQRLFTWLKETVMGWFSSEKKPRDPLVKVIQKEGIEVVLTCKLLFETTAGQSGVLMKTLSQSTFDHGDFKAFAPILEESSSLPISVVKRLRRSIVRFSTALIHDFFLTSDAPKKCREVVFCCLSRWQIFDLYREFLDHEVSIPHIPQLKSDEEQESVRLQAIRFCLFVHYFQKDLLKDSREVYHDRHGEMPYPLQVLSRGASPSFIHHFKKVKEIGNTFLHYSKRSLGEGSFKKVRLSLYYCPNQKIVELCASAMVDSDFQILLREAETMKALKTLTDRVIKVIGLGEYTGSNGVAKAQLIMEYARCDLFTLLDSGYKVKLSDFIGLAEGLKAIHSLGLYGIDLKRENILYVDGMLKYCDFEGALQNGENSENIVTTIGYMAPEILVAEEINEELTPAVDVFSLGIVFYMLSKRREPEFFTRAKDLGDFDTFKKALQSFLEEFAPENRIEELMTLMLEPDPSDRISAEDLYEQLLEIK